MKHKVQKNINDYEDMLYLPHHVSKYRTKMSIVDRAAQFSPFAAVVGHETAVKEAARNTDKRKELDEMEKAIIDNQLREIEARLSEGLEIEITYYVPDDLKLGGAYVSKVGVVQKFDHYEGRVLMMDGSLILIEDIYSINI